MLSRELCLLSGNRHKLAEMEVVASAFGYRLSPCGSADKAEVQSDSLEEIALFAAKAASRELREFLVEDSGLFVRALGGFPGPYSSYAFRTIGIAGVLRLMECVDDRSAAFRSAVAYVDREGRIRVFSGSVDGLIARRPSGSAGFGFDPIFKPAGYSRTFAEMELEEKAWISHRGLATYRLMRWLDSEKR